MKLSSKTIKDLIEILNAQSGVKRIKNAKLYQGKLRQVSTYLNKFPNKRHKAGTYHFKVYSGGIRSAVFADNKENLQLAEAAKTHKKAALAFQEKRPKVLVEPFLEPDRTLLV